MTQKHLTTIIALILIGVSVLYPTLSRAEFDLDVPREKVVGFALYTVHNNTLKLTAQFYPLKDDEPRMVQLETMIKGEWKKIATTKIIDAGWTAPFRIENWDSAKTVKYRVAYNNNSYYTGTIKKDPINQKQITVFAFTGNSIHAKHGGDISREDLVNNILNSDPDLLFFSGDQVYDHRRHYEMWMKFGRDFGRAMRHYPTITIPDDHDVGQPNLWGASGKKSKGGGATDGGYVQPASYVQEVERAQTSHLPDPYDPTPIQRGIGVYYTQMTVGGISFAILEDRKFKTGPEGLIPQQGPRPDHIRNPDYDPTSVDVPEAVLLGKRQLNFLADWSTDWTGAEMKCVLSQTIFCGGAHIHGKIGGRLHADLDSNGWPQTGRNNALKAMRKAYAFHIAGDQHLATIFHHGVDDWEDAGYSFCVPSIANLYLRWWSPLEPGANRKPSSPEYTGRHLDGFGNKVTCYAAANPDAEASGGKLTTRAAGFGVVVFDKSTREITMTCWPRHVDITAKTSLPYLGWPLTISQEDNYARGAMAWLPTLELSGIDDPVIQVINENTKEIEYTLRINGNTFRPKIFATGKHTVKISKDGIRPIKILTGLRSVSKDDPSILKIKL